MKLDGRKKREIRLALMEAFPRRAMLDRLVSDVLSVPLQNITAESNDLETTAFDLVVWVEARGRVTELIIGAAAASPDSQPLKALASEFQFVGDLPGEVERIIQKDVPFENIGQFIELLSCRRRAVCRVEPQAPPDKSGYGTAFLVASDVVMTNYHVIEPFLNSGADKVNVRFDYEVGLDGASFAQGRSCKLAVDWRLIDSPLKDLDFALIRLAEPAGEDAVPGGKRGTLKPTCKTLQEGNPLMILQHPDAEPLKLAIGSVVKTDAGSNRFSYTVNTEPGSSGSPVFNSGLDLVGLHHWGATPNRGVRMAAILDFLNRKVDEMKAKGLGGQISGLQGD